MFSSVNCHDKIHTGVNNDLLGNSLLVVADVVGNTIEENSFIFCLLGVYEVPPTTAGSRTFLQQNPRVLNSCVG